MRKIRGLFFRPKTQEPVKRTEREITGMEWVSLSTIENLQQQVYKEHERYLEQREVTIQEQKNVKELIDCCRVLSEQLVEATQ